MWLQYKWRSNFWVERIWAILSSLCKTVGKYRYLGSRKYATHSTALTYFRFSKNIILMTCVPFILIRVTRVWRLEIWSTCVQWYFKVYKPLDSYCRSFISEWNHLLKIVKRNPIVCLSNKPACCANSLFNRWQKPTGLTIYCIIDCRSSCAPAEIRFVSMVKTWLSCCSLSIFPVFWAKEGCGKLFFRLV